MFSALDFLVGLVPLTSEQNIVSSFRQLYRCRNSLTPIWNYSYFIVKRSSQIGLQLLNYSNWIFVTRVVRGKYCYVRKLAANLAHYWSLYWISIPTTAKN